MIYCVGEILADMIGRPTANGFVYSRRAGGAPFNVACAANKLGASVGFAGAVGNDLIGDYLLSFAQQQAFASLSLEKKMTRNTTLAFVELDEAGERRFSFYRENTADICLPRLSEKILANTRIVHLGSLMLSSPRGRRYASETMKRAHRLGCLVSFDVNYREDIFPDPQSAKAIFAAYLAQADIVKFSEEEVGIFGSGFLTNELADKLILVTLGKRGSRFAYRGLSGEVASLLVKPVDTTGAGDAFLGAMLMQLDREEVWDAPFLRRALRFANIAGALTTLGEGAIDPLPSAAQVERHLSEVSL